MNIQDTVQKLRTAKSVPETVLTELPTIVTKFNVTSNLQLAHFLSQCGHESGSFKAITENLNYSDVNRIAQIFRHDVDLNKNRVVESAELENAKKYVKNPKALANFVYANQNGNGNEASGDGVGVLGLGLGVGVFCSSPALVRRLGRAGVRSVRRVLFVAATRGRS